jgi:CubicO group peptidase (beta-lactamase class C family)
MNRFYADSDPPSGLIGPAGDLVRFIIAYLNDGDFDGIRILSPQTVAMMTHEGHIRSVNTGHLNAPIHGLGWKIFQEEKRWYLTHGGVGPGFGSAMHLYPEELLGLTVIANDTTYDSHALLQLVARLDWN